MNNIEFSLIITAVLPALIVAAVAYYFLNSFLKNEETRRRFIMRKENQKNSLPVRLQAYERMTLFLERISPGKLLFRIKPTGDEANLYEQLLIKTIEQEFEHNLAQQIYISADCWDYIKTAKNATIGIIRKASSMEEVHDADSLRETILKSLMEKSAPSDAALAYVKREVRQFI